MLLNDPEDISISYEAIKEKNELLIANEHTRKQKSKERKTRKFSVPEKAFDPNQLSEKDWVKLGLSAKQAEVVLKFTKYGVYSNEDLKKIFVIPDELYLLIKDSTIYPEKRPTYQQASEGDKFEPVLVDLTVCTQEELMEVPGIGEYFSKKIIDYREKLGGYRSLDQLLELWKMDQEKLDKMRPYLKLENPQLIKININSANFETLNNHPYIEYAVANSIVKMREQSGEFTKVDDIKRSKLIDDELYAKISPYLTVKK